MDLASALPADWRRATLLGRMDFGAGPTPVLVRAGRLEDLSRVAPTVADLLNDVVEGAIPQGEDLGSFRPEGVRPAVLGATTPRLLAPVDLQCVKAAGVTFAGSLLERVIEERARGEAAEAVEVRAAFASALDGAYLRSVTPGSDAAAALKSDLIVRGLWSQYLEVAIGPDAEIFTKAPPLSAVGWGDYVGVRSDSRWSNPEPEVVLVCDGRGAVRGATLGNDVNLRDFEGRSALLLGKAKDNNAACAIGPFIRLFDASFDLDDVRDEVLNLHLAGADGFLMDGEVAMNAISRDPLDLVAQTVGEHHQYPDGFALFLGTMFAPVADRGAPGAGFTHLRGDHVRIASRRLGTLENVTTVCEDAPPWRLGLGALMRNLARRGLLAERQP